MSSPIVPIRLSRLTHLRPRPRSPLGLALASLVCVSAVALGLGCEARPVEAADGPASVAPPAGAPPATEPAPGPKPAHPLAGLERIDAQLVGDVAEVLPAGGYTDFRLADGTWAVVMGAGPAVGARIQARIFAERRNFRSRRLDRTFAAVRFVSLTGG